jgi:hypothetical protein
VSQTESDQKAGLRNWIVAQLGACSLDELRALSAQLEQLARSRDPQKDKR